MRRAVVTGVAVVALAVTAVAVLDAPANSPDGGTSTAIGGGDPPSVPTLPPAPSDPVPGDAIRVEPGDDLQALVAAHPPGTAFLLASGIHRQQSVRPRDGNRFSGEPGAVLSGAVLLDPADASRRGEHWAFDGRGEEGFVHGSMLAGHEQEAHPEDLWADGERLRHVAIDDLDEPGEWSFDYAADRVLLVDDPRGFDTLELAATEFAFIGEGVRDVTIENLTVRHYASWAQRGAINGRHSIGWTVRFVDASSNHAYGLGTGPGMLVEHSRFTDNGQGGLGGPGERHDDSGVAPGEVRPMRVVSNEIARNRQLGFDWRWEGGGTKFSVTVDMVAANNHVVDNGGPGLWWDIDNLDPVACANLVERNVLGMFPEIGQGGLIVWNEVHDNLRDGEEDASTGIFVSDTGDVEIRANAVSGQPLGILARDARDRDDSDLGPRRSTGLEVRDNRVAMDDHSGIRIETEATDGADTARFEDNHWWVPDPDGRYWVLGDDDRLLDWEAWQAAGMDRDGSVSRSTGDRPALPPDAVGFTPTHYGPLGAGDEPPAPPAASRCDEAL